MVRGARRGQLLFCDSWIADAAQTAIKTTVDPAKNGRIKSVCLALWRNSRPDESAKGTLLRIIGAPPNMARLGELSLPALPSESACSPRQFESREKIRERMKPRERRISELRACFFAKRAVRIAKQQSVAQQHWRSSVTSTYSHRKRI